MRSRNARTCSLNSSTGRAGSGKKFWGCQHCSTGLSSGNTCWVDQSSSDLKISIFSGGREWVFWGFVSAGAATAEMGGGNVGRNVMVGVKRWRWVRFVLIGVYARECWKACMVVVEELSECDWDL